MDSTDLSSPRTTGKANKQVDNYLALIKLGMASLLVLDPQFCQCSNSSFNAVRPGIGTFSHEMKDSLTNFFYLVIIEFELTKLKIIT